MELDCERKVSLVGCELQVVSTETKAQRFETLVLGYRDRSIRLAWRLLGAHRGAAEDVTQQAFVKAWNGFDRFRDDAQLRTWFRRILVNQVRSYLRWAAVREAARGFIFKQERPEPVMSDHGLKRRIQAAMDTLSAGQREAFTLVHLEGLSVTEAASSLGRAPGTVKSHLFRAHRQLRAQLSDLKENGS